MSTRWFRHYAGMARDEKLVSTAMKSNQPVERVIWLWIAILESAAGINNGGQYDIDHAEVAYFLRVKEEEITAILDALISMGRLADGMVSKWWRYVGDQRLPSAEWAEVRQRMFERDDFTCQYCGERGGTLECDHVVPVSRGGSNDPSNLTTACFSCNRSKRDHLLSEWVQ